MLLVDWITLGVLLLFALLGLIVGFGRGLRFFTRGFFGVFISIFVCYFIGGLIMNITFVQDLMAKFVEALTDKNIFCDILLTIRIQIIVYYLALFIVVQIIRVIIVAIISRVFEIQNVLINVINRIFGLILFLCVLVIFVMIAFQIIHMIGGETELNVLNQIVGSKLKIDWLYDNNPLVEIIEKLFKLGVVKVEVPAV